MPSIKDKTTHGLRNSSAISLTSPEGAGSTRSREEKKPTESVPHNNYDKI